MVHYKGGKKPQPSLLCYYLLHTITFSARPESPLASGLGRKSYFLELVRNLKAIRSQSWRSWNCISTSYVAKQETDMTPACLFLNICSELEEF